MKDAESYYDELGERYWNMNNELDSYHLMRFDSFRYLAEKYFEKGSKILDFGCGSGELTKLLIDLGFDANGCDISNEMVKLAKAKVGESRAFKGGVEALEHVEPIQGIVALNVFPYMTEEEELRFFINARGKLGGGTHSQPCQYFV